MAASVYLSGPDSAGITPFYQKAHFPQPDEVITENRAAVSLGNALPQWNLVLSVGWLACCIEFFKNKQCKEKANIYLTKWCTEV